MTCWLLLVLLACPVWADNEPMYVQAVLGGAVVTTGEMKATIVPYGRLRGDGPLMIGRRAPLRLYAQISIASLPDGGGPMVPYRSLELAAGAYRELGHMNMLSQYITTNVFLEAGFSSRLPRKVPPLVRYPRHYLVGVRFQENVSGGYFSLGYGRHEAVGDSYGGEVVMSGAVPVLGSNDIVMVGADAMLSVGRTYGGIQRNIIRFSVGVNAIRVLDLLSQ